MGAELVPPRSAILAAYATDMTDVPPMPAAVHVRILAALDAAADSSQPPAGRPLTGSGIGSGIGSRIGSRPGLRLVVGSAAAAVVLALIVTAWLMPSPTQHPGLAARTPTLSNSPHRDRIPTDTVDAAVGSNATFLSVLGSSKLGAFSDPGKRARCLAGAGLNPGAVLIGAGPAEISGQQATVLLLPSGVIGQITAVAVDASCGDVGGGTGVLVLRTLGVPR